MMSDLLTHPSIFCSAYPTQGCREPGVYLRRLGVKGGGLSGQGSIEGQNRTYTRTMDNLGTTKHVFGLG